MVDSAVYAIGLAVVFSGGVGLMAVMFIWALDRLLKATGYAGKVMHWYIAECIKKRDAKRHRA